MVTTGSSESPLSSPARKRQRLSSPTYDEQIENFCPQDLQAFEELDAILSQNSPSRRSKLPGSPLSSPRRRNRMNANAHGTTLKSPRFAQREPTTPSHSQANTFLRDNLDDDPENPFTEVPAKPKSMGFASASNIPAPALFIRGKALLADPNLNRSRSPTPEEQKPPDLSAWFNGASQPQTTVVGFQTFSTAASAIPEGEAKSIGFSTLSGKGIVAPSAAAMAKAAQLMKEWEDDLQEEETLPEIPPRQKSLPPPPPPPRAAEQPATPKPGFVHPKKPLTASATSFTTPSQSRMHPARFRSPLISKAAMVTDSPTPSASTSSGSLLNPNNARQPQTPLPIRSETPFRASHPLRTPASRPMRGGARFVTPFKPGMRPEDSSRTVLLQAASQQPISPLRPLLQTAMASTSKLTTAPKHNKRQNKTTLASSGLKPQSHTTDQLEGMLIDVKDLQNINPRTGHYYSFNTPKGLFGVDTAIQLFKERGYDVPKGWVKNHWNLILWKLAGMVALDPQHETDESKKRWSWDEVLRQLSYRYEREINGAARPPLQLITTQDAPASSPMVLCVSNITWMQGHTDEKGNVIERYPCLEVTDGWYMLRAQVDEPLARAARRGLIVVGRKIITAGAKLLNEKKDPSEVLEAYDSVQLRFNANSTQLAPWHAKLGFQRGPFISTMHSLDSDGGSIAVMDLVVIKAHPIAFIELFEGSDNKQSSPRNEADEAKAQSLWQRRREDKEGRARETFSKRIDKWERILERCEQKARGKSIDHSLDIPSKIERLYDELDDYTGHSSIFSNMDALTAAWLAYYIRTRIGKDRETASEAIADEVNEACPPRNVRSFRVLEVQDARTCRRPANRTAQLTVWDVLHVTLSEGGRAGHFAPGDRFLATNLGTTQRGSWMGTEPDSYIYMRTNRNSRYTRIRTRV